MLPVPGHCSRLRVFGQEQAYERPMKLRTEVPKSGNKINKAKEFSDRFKYVISILFPRSKGREFALTICILYVR